MVRQSPNWCFFQPTSFSCPTEKLKPYCLSVPALTWLWQAVTLNAALYDWLYIIHRPICMYSWLVESNVCCSTPSPLTLHPPHMYVWGVHVALQLLDAHLGNGTGHRTVTMAAPLLFTSGLVRYEAVLHSYGESLVGRAKYWLLSVRTHDDFIVLPHGNTRPLATWPAIPLSCIILSLSQPVLVLF